MSNEKTYYSLDRLLSYGAMFNIAVGARGLGKTYACKKRAIKRALDGGEEFVYLRRFQTELKHVSTFFNDIRGEFPEWELSVDGRKAKVRPKGSDGEWTTIGYFLALTAGATLKSVSYPNVHTLIFDEFIIEEGTRHYLPAEVDTFLDLYSTIDRNNDRVKVFMLSNAVRCVNPYFIEWRIQTGKAFQRRGGGYLVCELIDNGAFAGEVSRTRFGKFIKETSPEYASYAIDNLFSDDTEDLLGKKPPEARLIATLRTRTGEVSLWHDDMMWYVQRKLPRDCDVRLAYKVRARDGERVQTKGEGYMAILVHAIKDGRVRFDSIESRETIWSVLL